MNVPTAATEIDPITVEILSNRLWITNDEAAATVRRVSGSPVATEICDFNTALLRANGDAFMVGTYMAFLSLGHDAIVKDILANYADNPGIGPADMFICSDPYRGCTHQNDVTLVAPIHYQDELIAWSGVTIHQVDVGGPVYGSQASVGATSIYQEALPMPPMKIVEDGVLRKDLEEEYLIRSRTRETNALDLRAKMAANNLAKARILECVERYGLETVQATIDSVIDSTEARLRARLRRLPDGIWRHRAYMDDSPGKTHYLEVSLSKRDSELCFDFTRTGPQTGAIFNCSKGGLMSGLLGSVLPVLFYGMYWCPAAAQRVIELKTTPGTLVDAEWPAGMCKATTAAIAMVNTMANVVLGKMMAGSGDAEIGARAMAPWMAAATVQELSGTDQRGQEFGATLLDPMAGGGGAKADGDGIDSGSVIRAVKLRIANVETYEFRYPMLYLYRRQLEDTAGAGMFRGGAGCSLMYTPHGTDEIPASVMHSINYQVPATVGIFGGYPASTNSMAILRDSDVWERLSAGDVPNELEALTGDLEPVPIMQSTGLHRGDVYHSITTGGGGFGDPLQRDPGAVQRDVASGATSQPWGETVYGVVLTAEGGVDEERTEVRRKEIRAERLTLAAPPAHASQPTRHERAELERSLGGCLRLYRIGSAQHYGCSCGWLLAPAGQPYKDGLRVLESPTQEAGPRVDPYRIGVGFVFRRFVCPSCGSLIETEVARVGEPALVDIEILTSDTRGG